MAGGKHVTSADILRAVDIIREAALAGHRCPGNVELSERLGFGSMSTGARIIQVAVAAGLITVERGLNSRVVSAADGSWRTAGDIGRPHWSVVGVGTKVDGYGRPRKNPAAPRKVRVAPQPARAAAIAAPPPPPPPPPPPLVADAPAPPPARAPAATSDRGCRWPSGDPYLPGLRFCCAPIARGSYCAAHDARAYDRRGWPAFVADSKQQSGAGVPAPSAADLPSAAVVSGGLHAPVHAGDVS